MSVRMQPAVLDAEPAWEIAKIFHAQGAWAEEDYLLLPGNRLSVYAIHGVYDRSSVAESALLPGFTVDVEACFAEGEQA